MTAQRGVYRPFDHERHWVAAWGEQEVAGIARDQTLGAALRPVMPAVELSSRFARGARGVYIGASGLGNRGDADKPLARVGGEWFHSVSDRARAVDKLSTEFAVLANELGGWLKVHPEQATARWVTVDVMPSLESWKKFAESESSSWWTRAATSWEAFEEWYDKLVRMRALVRAHGVELTSPEPGPLPKTIWQRGENGEGGQAVAWLGVLKVAIMAGIGITGFVTLYAVLRDITKPRK